MPLQDELVELEHGFWEAAGNGAFYREHMAEGGLCILPPGILNKEETIEAIAQADPWIEHRFADIVTIQHCETSATLCYVGRARRTGSEEYRAAISTTYDRRADRWLLTVHQQTPLTV